MRAVSDESSSKNRIAEIFLIYSLWFFVHGLVILSFFYFDLFSKVPLREDIQHYLTYANFVLAGFPDKSFPLVYPPIALLLFAFARLFTPTLVTYQRVFFLIMVVFDFLSFSIVVKVAGRAYANKRLWRLLVPLIYMVFLLSIGHLIYFRYDLVPAFLVLLAFFFFQARSPLLTWLVLALAVATKGFAIVIVPVFLILLLRQPISKILKGFALFLATLGFFYLHYYILAPTGCMESFAIHGRRGLEIGSTYASVLMILNRFGLPLQVKFEEKGYQAIEVVSQYTPFIAKISIFFMVAILASIYLHLFLSRRWMIDREISKAQVFFRYSTSAILAFTLTFKVFSPQYLIWICPLIPLVRLQDERQTLKMWLVFLLACILTQIMVFNIWDLINLHPLAVGILIVRNLLLWYMLYLLMFKTKESSSRKHFS